MVRDLQRQLVELRSDHRPRLKLKAQPVLTGAADQLDVREWLVWQTPMPDERDEFTYFCAGLCESFGGDCGIAGGDCDIAGGNSYQQLLTEISALQRAC